MGNRSVSEHAHRPLKVANEECARTDVDPLAIERGGEERLGQLADVLLEERCQVVPSAP
jgi:hypothetical protein